MEVLSSLVERIKKRECILFLGAGVHCAPPVGDKFEYPKAERPALGRDLSEKLAGVCRYQEKFPQDSIHDLQRVALCVEKTPGLGRAFLVDLLTRHLAEGKRPSPALRMLAELPFSMVVTTNYDRLFEESLYMTGKNPFVTIYDPGSDRPAPVLQSDPTEQRPLLFKMSE